MKLLKFCNIKNIFETRTAASLGVPFLGYHLISENDFARYDDIKYCVQELRNYYPTTKAILVTKERDTKKLSSLIREIEFDGIQLHYPNSNNQAAALKGEFGNKFIVFQVISLESKDFFPTQADYVLLDKSYLGGTGLQISNKDVQKMLNRLKNNKILLAGGISSTNLYRYLDFPVDGFDVQSAIKTLVPKSGKMNFHLNKSELLEQKGHLITTKPFVYFPQHWRQNVAQTQQRY